MNLENFVEFLRSRLEESRTALTETILEGIGYKDERELCRHAGNRAMLLELEKKLPLLLREYLGDK